MTKEEKIQLRTTTAANTINTLVQSSGYSWAISSDEINQWAVDIVNDQEAVLPDTND